MSIFINNKYFILYKNIIKNAKSQMRKKLKSNNPNYVYYEKHHIIPKSFFKYRKTKNLCSERTYNMVLLTAKEHIICHHLLTKFTKGRFNDAAIYAYWCMCVKDNGGKNIRIVSAHHLSKSREMISKAAKLQRLGQVFGPRWYSGTLDEFKIYLQSLVDSGLSDPKIAKMFGVSSTIIHSWRHKCNILKRRPLLNNKEFLYNLYITENKTTEEISKIIGCTKTAISQKLKHFNISTRTSHECQKIAQSKRTKIRQITYDNGDIEIIKIPIKLWCKNRGYNARSLYSVSVGRRTRHKDIIAMITM